MQLTRSEQYQLRLQLLTANFESCSEFSKLAILAIFQKKLLTCFVNKLKIFLWVLNLAKVTAILQNNILNLALS